MSEYIRFKQHLDEHDDGYTAVSSFLSYQTDLSEGHCDTSFIDKLVKKLESPLVSEGIFCYTMQQGMKFSPGNRTAEKQLMTSAHSRGIGLFIIIRRSAI